MENKLQSIGYCRTSTKRQSLDTQIYLLKENGVPDDLIFMDEGVSGTILPKSRAGFRLMYRYIKENAENIDKLYVYDISRLGRTFVETFEIIDDLETTHDIMVISLSKTEAWLQSEDRNLRSGVILPILSWVASKEIENLKARINAGLDRARREGKTLGRPRREIDWKQVDLYRERKLSWSAIAKVLDISEGTLHSSHRRRMREQMINRAKEAKRE